MAMPSSSIETALQGRLASKDRTAKYENLIFKQQRRSYSTSLANFLAVVHESSFMRSEG
jgi:hypothetical protein